MRLRRPGSRVAERGRRHRATGRSRRLRGQVVHRVVRVLLPVRPGSSRFRSLRRARRARRRPLRPRLGQAAEIVIVEALHLRRTISRSISLGSDQAIIVIGVSRRIDRIRTSLAPGLDPGSGQPPRRRAVTVDLPGRLSRRAERILLRLTQLGIGQRRDVIARGCPDAVACIGTVHALSVAVSAEA
jgi:hypothetical protein